MQHFTETPHTPKNLISFTLNCWNKGRFGIKDSGTGLSSICAPGPHQHFFQLCSKNGQVEAELGQAQDKDDVVVEVRSSS